ncbi:MAG: mechanosensitive ion channel [Anaerolineales bacterium]
MDQIWQDLIDLIGGDVLSLLAGIGLLFVGWLIALIVSAIVRNLLKRVKLNERLVGVIGEEGTQARPDIEKWISSAVFYLLLLFVLVAFLQIVQLPAVAEPLNAMLTQITLAAPKLLGALVIILIAWVIAVIVKSIVLRTLRLTKLEERLSTQAQVQPKTSTAEALANGMFWLVLLLFLPAVLSVLELEGLVEPVTGVVNSILGAVPSIFTAAIYLLAGWLLARIVRQIVTNLLAATNIDSIGKQVGINDGTQPMSQIIGTIVYVLILIPTVITALNALGVEAISKPAITMLTTVMNAIPVLFGAALVLIIAYVAGRLVSVLATNLLAGVGFDRVPEILGLRLPDTKSERSLSEVAGYIVLAAVILLAAIEASSLLGFEFLATILAAILAFGGQVLVALLIFAIGLYLANLAHKAILAAGGARANLLANLARVAILILIAAMSLSQLGVAAEVITIAFGVLLGTIGIAAALAFGLGARDTAGRIVENWSKEVEEKK